MDKAISARKVTSRIKDGDTLMIGDFLGRGIPHHTINYIIDETNLRDLTIIGSDTTYIGYGVGPSITKKKVKHVTVSYIGTNRKTGRQMNENKTEITLVPQGALVERVRTSGYGLGGVLIGTGVGTPEVEEGK